MGKIIIFYDETKASCCRWISRFEGHDNVECRKASDYAEKRLIFATGAKIGLVFESENGKVPYAVSHIIWRMTADKKEEHMILVTGGRRELKAIQAAEADMEKRGYYVGNIYIRYMLDKYKVKEEEAVEWILNDMETGQAKDNVKKKYINMPRRELKKALRREFREYRKYQRDCLKGDTEKA